MVDPHEPGSGHPWEPDLHLAADRIAERHRQALDGRLAARMTSGRVDRLRDVVGARLIALGTSLAGPERPLVRRPERRP